MRTIGVAAAALLAALACSGAVSAQQTAGQTAPPPRMGQPQGRAGAPQTPPTLVEEVQRMFNVLKTNFTKSADLFPEDKYDWKPTPDVRTWAGLFGHLIDDNNGSCSALAGETPPPGLDNEGQPTDAAKGLKKADIVRLLAESFARCDTAFAAVTPDNMLDRLRPGNVNRSKVGALIYNTQHISEHYGNAVTYMRLQGIVPPSSAPRTGRGF